MTWNGDSAEPNFNLDHDASATVSSGEPTDGQSSCAGAYSVMLSNGKPSVVGRGHGSPDDKNMGTVRAVFGEGNRCGKARQPWAKATSRETYN